MNLRRGLFDGIVFLSSITTGDMLQRLCTAGELEFYFTNFLESSGPSSFLQPNRNCNTTEWVQGCDPGWGCTTGLNQTLNFRDSEIPARNSDCQPCCAGFFCPRGLTCMIPCPLGSYCPTATFNDTTGLCDPYLQESRIIMSVDQLIFGQMSAEADRCSVQPDRIARQIPWRFLAPPGTIVEWDPHSRRVRCYRLTSCNANTSSQNLTQYGLMLIVAISVVLFAFYNCYERVVNLRKIRYARSREVAVNSVKSHSQARDRWMAAKDAILQGAAGLSSSCSHLNTVVPIEQMPEAEEYQNNNTWREIDQEIGGNDQKKKKKKKSRHIRGNTQIFEYAYSELEKEKARAHQQRSDKEFTFCGVVSMAMNSKIRRRPLIEIAFRDLSVSLKKGRKHLLRSITGEILPGRITALMGPSGAGKTTLLSALAGKTAGCSITGLILINKRVESIRSYKKIVGFVPQDDIVHGNLTVQENIWFSADCRLSANLSRPDKVLVVERVIDSLGLQSVRDSLVGTVEKRGISGGQRKRVNVALELVIEPSLLFLDEPTSGLDSSSSQLLLWALKREALEGVNICMVVHQPSYSLFKMFDDLILLAKGGFTAYLGPVTDVEDYFESLCINVPERINPPDYYIDILEGMVKPSTSSGVTYQELPLRWMLHKGYSIPPDIMQDRIDPAAGAIINTRNTAFGYQHRPFCGEFLFNMKYKLESMCEIIQNKFRKPKDFSGRKTAPIPLQYRYFLERIAKQRLREARSQAIDYLILLLAGACLGLIAKAGDENFGAPGYTYTIIATSLLCKIAALRTFSQDKLQYRRERSSGISSLAHFVAKDTIDHFNTLIKPLFYLCTYYFFSDPRSTFLDNYIVLLCLMYCVTGIGYTLAIFLEPGPSQLCSVLLPVVLTLVSTQPKNSRFIKTLSSLFYPSWALEAFIVANAKRYDGVWLIQRCGALLRTGFNLHEWALCISLLMAAGAACRVLAFIGMLTLQKK
ncbi:hypothetical protein M569_01083 [Genlisea aurea]|uniref:ABC transporter domain-containing protein n=1 Tax=Genlisea aurea TaxID=192259 RepID=S8D2P4_9LAMI|nr:hypothetical protein M569_01083 [Genlisea aurea]